MAQFNYFNLGQSMAQGEQIKTQRYRNQMIEQEQEATKQRQENLAKVKAIRAAFAAMPEQIEELEANGMFDDADKLRETYIKQKKAGISMIKDQRDFIDADNYDAYREDLIKSGAVEPELMPPEYSDDWFRKEEEREIADLKKITLKWEEQGVVFSKDLLAQGGNIVQEGKPYKEQKGGAGGGYGGIKASDSNSIRNASAMVFGGMWDPVTQQYSGLDKKLSAKVGTLSAEAARIYDKNEGRLPHDMAVARAARKLGIDIQDLEHVQAGQSANPADPLGWR